VPVVFPEALKNKAVAAFTRTTPDKHTLSLVPEPATPWSSSSKYDNPADASVAEAVVSEITAWKYSVFAAELVEKVTVEQTNHTPLLGKFQVPSCDILVANDEVATVTVPVYPKAEVLVGG